MVTVEPGGPQIGNVNTAKVDGRAEEPEFVGAHEQAGSSTIRRPRSRRI